METQSYLNGDLFSTFPTIWEKMLFAESPALVLSEELLSFYRVKEERLIDAAEVESLFSESSSFVCSENFIEEEEEESSSYIEDIANFGNHKKFFDIFSVAPEQNVC